MRAVEKHQRALRVARHGDRLQCDAAEIELVAVIDGQRAHRAERHHVVHTRQECALRLAARDELIPARGIAVLVEQRDIRRVHAADTVFKRRARMVDMAVREHKLHRQVGQLAHKRFQAADAGQAVDQQRALLALDEIAQLAAKSADLRDVFVNLMCCEKF